MKKLILISLCLTLLLTGPAAQAAVNYLKATPSSHPVYVDGERVYLEAYTINGANYVKLRDIGEAVGFNVYWTDSVQVDSDAPYTGVAPAGAATVPTAGGLSRNADGSINVPSDGSRYVPQTGDVIRCDDGSNYAIADVSRYDKSMFASGPLPELPTPTCDWSSFPEVALPEPEARRFTLEDGDYLFIRNLHESRRMQYTLQNLAGNHPDTSEDGRLKYGSKGTPAVRISLSIDSGLEPWSFWPWRESEIERVFNSCPPGTYSMESWDVYKDGVYQHTRYNIHAI